MGLSHGRQTVVKLDDLPGALQDISGTFDSFKYNPKSARPVTTAFGDTGTRRQLLGLRDPGQFNHAGWFLTPAGAKAHGRQASLLLDQYSLIGRLDKATIRRMRSYPDTPAFGDTWIARGVPGLLDGSGSFEGNLNGAASEADAILRATLGNAPGGNAPKCLLSLAPAGFALGAVAEMAQIAQGDYSISSPVDNVNRVAASWDAEDQIDLGVSLHDNVVEGTFPFTGTGVDESAATTAGAVAFLHVVSVTGTATVKVQHSTDNVTFADLITFTGAASALSERKTVAVGTTINRYVRVNVTGPTLCQFVVTFARRGFTYGAAGTYRHLAGMFGLAATSTYQYGPEGSATGALRKGGELWAQQLEVSLDVNAAVKFSGTLLGSGAVTEDTWP